MEFLVITEQYSISRKISHKKLIIRDRLEASKNNLIMTKEQRLQEECSKGEYAPPCGPTQVGELRDNSWAPFQYKGVALSYLTGMDILPCRRKFDQTFYSFDHSHDRTIST